ncbi:MULTISPECIES: hypothetical protein [Vibrio]|uniref:hypothetical protein n=1 Tax=Vibrio TaxID=662 RepID=UPI0002EA473E|nr:MULTISPECIES: hypothetical protein [Vibrio]EHK6026289.1 hypothetical protein [Vibrio parahaemolyticus]EHY9845583.1 hypothetical protein [Vibrio cholerae]MCQ9090708.1 hypothetical protein [Vibrio alginolyticus]MCS0096654.1 hypothetical protein [Vibrio cholerae]
MTYQFFGRLGLLLLFPVLLMMAAVLKPLFWVVKYGWVNTPFWHNVLAGYLQVKEICFK